MSIRKPMILVLAGPNGSGKSTIAQYFDKVVEYSQKYWNKLRNTDAEDGIYRICKCP